MQHCKWSCLALHCYVYICLSAVAGAKAREEKEIRICKANPIYPSLQIPEPNSICSASHKTNPISSSATSVTIISSSSLLQCFSCQKCISYLWLAEVVIEYCAYPINAQNRVRLQCRTMARMNSKDFIIPPIFRLLCRCPNHIRRLPIGSKQGKTYCEDSFAGHNGSSSQRCFGFP